MGQVRGVSLEFSAPSWRLSALSDGDVLTALSCSTRCLPFAQQHDGRVPLPQPAGRVVSNFSPLHSLALAELASCSFRLSFSNKPLRLCHSSQVATRSFSKRGSRQHSATANAESRAVLKAVLAKER